MRREHPLTFSLCDVFGNGAAHNTGGIQELREQLKLDPGGGTCLSSPMVIMCHTASIIDENKNVFYARYGFVLMGAITRVGV